MTKVLLTITTTFCALLATPDAAAAQPLDCVLTATEAKTFEGACRSTDLTFDLTLTPPTSSRGRNKSSGGVWTGVMHLPEGQAPIEWLVATSEVSDSALFKTPFGWLPSTQMQLSPGAIKASFHLSVMASPEAVDLAILRRAKLILARESQWNRNDDRVCEEADTTFSLYCALHRASIQETGTFEHRRPALEEIRLAVEHLSRGHDFEHRLRDFNNLPENELADVKRAFDLATRRITAKLEGRPWLELIPYSVLGIQSERTASVGLADIDNDGDLDAVAVNGRHWPGQNRLYVNNGKGKLGLSRLLGAEQATSYAAPFADFDEDGDLDIAVGNDDVRNLLYLNDGQGHFTPGTVFGGIESTRGVTLADLDADGHVDILLTNRGDPNTIHFGDGKAAFPRQTTFGTATDSTIDVATGDVDGDGDLDLALANRDGQPNFVYLNDGTGNFTTGSGYGTGSDETRAVALADLDADGHLDIINGNIEQPNAVYFGDGSGHFNSRVEFGTSDGPTFAVAITDLDLDGDLDIVVGQAGTQNAAYLNRGDGRGFDEVLFGDEEGDTYGIAVGDLNDDGFPEVLTANSDSRNGIFANGALKAKP